MLSEKLLRILKAKSPFSAEEIGRLTEKEGWDWVYSLAKPKEKLLQICFTGFSAEKKEQLQALATEAGLHVTKIVTKELAFLCTGENAGPSKVEKARKQNVVIFTREQFELFLETGEIP
jgi:BRCT domain type II-containing protein